MKTYQVEKKRLPKSAAELKVILPVDFLLSAKGKALQNLSSDLEIPGFRKGHVPPSIAENHFGNDRLLQESANLALSEHFPKIIEQENLDVLGHPHISITKLAFGNPMEFTATVSLMPEFELPDYRAIARSAVAKAKEDKFEATEKEIDDVLLQIRKNKAHIDWHRAHKGEDHDHPDLEKEENLPALDDKLAQEAGDFKNLDELREKIKQNIAEDKKYKNIEKIRAEIMEELVKNTNIEIPDILVESETDKSIARMKDDLGRAVNGTKQNGAGDTSHESAWQDYLSHIKKDEASLRKELEKNSEKKAKIQLIFNKIAAVEKLGLNKEILEHEVAEIMRLYPDASVQNARTYVETILLNQEVLKMLEKE
jgi:FKBP-type peptidyl-prolyl cis-trans isomerase (trigger factor)